MEMLIAFVVGFFITRWFVETQEKSDKKIQDLNEEKERKIQELEAAVAQLKEVTGGQKSVS